MKINPDDPKWTAYVLGELNDVERVAAEVELESSASARELVDEIRLTTAWLREEMESAAPSSLLADQRMAIHAAAAPRSRFGLSALAFAAVAAGLIIAFIATPALMRARRTVEVLPHIALTEQPPAVGTVAGEPIAPVSSSPNEPPSIQPRQEEKQKTIVQGQQARQAEAQSSLLPAGSEARDNSVGTVANEAGKAGDPGISETVLVYVPAPQNQAAPPLPPSGPNALSRAGADSALNALYGKSAVGKFAAARGNPGTIAPPMTSVAPLPDAADRTRFNTEAYDQITDNPFIRVTQDALATFSIDVDTASYANMRRFLSQNLLPPRDSIRIEEMINYFTYDYAAPKGPHPIAVYTEIASAPWKSDHRLVRIGIKGKEINIANRPSTNLVFLVDVSGSMNSPAKLPLLKSAMKLLIDQLTENDRVAIVVYAGASGLVLPSTGGDKKEQIVQAIDQLNPGGSTNGAAGIQLAYDTAVSHFIRGGVNRVVLATDGDFNVGVTSQGDLLRLIEDKARSNVFLSVLGFGMGNLKDSTLEKLADRGNGNYAYIDNLGEARKVLVEELGGTLVAIAKDVKVQIEFNPAEVNAYRLIGYENRILRPEDFNNDAKDAGDMGAGHTVTALFEVVPKGVDISVPGVDALRYQQQAQPSRRGNAEMLHLRIRYKEPESSESKLLEVPVADRGTDFSSASTDYRFAAAVASFGMILRDSPYKGSSNLDTVIDLAEKSRGADKGGYREEFAKLARKARAIRDLQ